MEVNGEGHQNNYENLMFRLFVNCELCSSLLVLTFDTCDMHPNRIPYIQFIDVSHGSCHLSFTHKLSICHNGTRSLQQKEWNWNFENNIIELERTILLICNRMALRKCIKMVLESNQLDQQLHLVKINGHIARMHFFMFAS